MDEKDWLILEALQENARTGFAELARTLDLSAPTVAERIRRLEDAGVITGYHAAVDPAALGFGLPVSIRMNVANRDYSRFHAFVEHAREITECHHVTGAEAFQLQAQVESVEALERLIGRLSQYGQTSTSLVLSRFLGRRVFRKPGAARRNARHER